MSHPVGIPAVALQAVRRLARLLCLCGIIGCVAPEVVGLATASAPSEPGGARTSGVEIRFLANAGFLLRAGDTGVVIDAFLARPYSVYGEIPDETLRELILGGAPFHTVRLALVSHRHEDHFQVDVASVFLQRRPAVQLVSSPQVIDALRAHIGDVPANAHVVWPDSGETVTWDATPGVEVEFLDLPHGSSRHADVQNLASVVTLGGRKVLHLGDATMQSRAYAAYADQLHDIDVALIPYWFFEDEDGEETLDTWLSVPVQIATHLPVRDAEVILQRLQKSHPQVKVLSKPLQFLRY